MGRRPIALPYPDRQLRFAAVLPDFDDWLGWMETASADGPAWTRTAYGPDPRQWVETAPGSGTGDVVPLFLHGGYWRALDAGRHRFVHGGLAPLGPAVANAEYRLMPGTRMEGVIADATRALESVAAAFPACRVLVVGHSAGAHLAHHAAARSALPGDRIAGVVAISGLFDLGPVAESFLQAELSLTAAEVAAFSPLRQAEHRPLRRLLVVGEAETGLYHRQAAAFAARTGAALTVVEGAHHMAILAGLAEPGAGLAGAIAAFARGEAPPDAVAGT